MSKGDWLGWEYWLIECKISAKAHSCLAGELHSPPFSDRMSVVVLVVSGSPTVLSLEHS